MTMQFQVSSGGGPPIGLYKANFVGVDKTEPNNQLGKGVQFRWKIVGGEHDGEEATVICGIETPASPQNRLGRILGGLVGKPVVPGETISVEPCIGRTYLIQVEQARSGIATGTANKAWVLDIEVAGMPHRNRLEQERVSLPRTCVSITGGGGQHFSFSGNRTEIKRRRRNPVEPFRDTIPTGCRLASWPVTLVAPAPVD